MDLAKVSCKFVPKNTSSHQEGIIDSVKALLMQLKDFPQLDGILGTSEEERVRVKEAILMH